MSGTRNSSSSKTPSATPPATAVAVAGCSWESTYRRIRIKTKIDEKTNLRRRCPGARGEMRSPGDATLREQEQDYCCKRGFWNECVCTGVRSNFVRVSWAVMHNSFQNLFGNSNARSCTADTTFV